MDSIEVHYPMLVLIHVFFDTRPIIMPSSCGNGSLGQGAGSLRIPPYCPHLNQLSGYRPHAQEVTHNKCYALCGQFADAMLDFLRDKVPKIGGSFRD
jgi:hypothetical protein